MFLGRAASAQESEDPARDASRHFRRGVELYGEADYAGALVEFRRAYALSPNTAALYNVGESQFQLQDYAGALKTFRHFLASAGPGEPHRAEVEGDVQVLRSRVGRVQIISDPPGADVAVDDQPVGKTPIEEPILVSVGHRKLVASMAGRPSVTNYVDVAAGDEVRVTLSLPATADVASPSPLPSREQPSPPSSPAPRRPGQSAAPAIGWSITATLAAGSAAFGVLALTEANHLNRARSGLSTSGTLSQDANRMTTYAVLADSLAAAAVVVGGLSLYWTLSQRSAEGGLRAGAPPRVALGLGSAHFEMNF